MALRGAQHTGIGIGKFPLLDQPARIPGLRAAVEIPVTGISVTSANFYRKESLASLNEFLKSSILPTLVEIGSPTQCPACIRAVESLKELAKNYDGKLNIVSIDLDPLTNDERAEIIKLYKVRDLKETTLPMIRFFNPKETVPRIDKKLVFETWPGKDRLINIIRDYVLEQKLATDTEPRRERNRLINLPDLLSD